MLIYMVIFGSPSWLLFAAAADVAEGHSSIRSLCSPKPAAIRCVDLGEFVVIKEGSVRHFS